MTAQATEVHCSDVSYFKVTYHSREYLWDFAFRLESRLRGYVKKDQKKQSEETSIQVHEGDFDVHPDEETRKEALADAQYSSTDSDLSLIHI